tara:strand:- start:257 stop:1015 length:759 start_codon:yes stop_codon:yes gene_type:complete
MQEVAKLSAIVKTLRAPGGCPWDREQTFLSLIPCIIEEAYELVDALESGNINDIIEECGDSLLQVIMLATIAAETDRFNLGSIADAAAEKMIRRHPHVFADKQLNNVNEVLTQWDEIKQTEKTYDSVMDNIPQLPALLKAQKIQKRASKVGFDWPDTAGAIKKITEETAEFEQALQQQDTHDIEAEAGDLLFAIVNVLRKENINAEEALRKANKKFVKRYKKMEQLTPSFNELNLDQKEALWDQAKKLCQAE